MNIGLIVLGLAFLFFLVVTYFAAKTWHVGHVVAMAFLFLFTLLFLFMTATLMRTQAKYRPQYAKAVQDYEREVERERQLRSGDPSSPAGLGTLMGERKLVRVQHATIGRTFGNVRAQIAGNGPIQLDMRAWTNSGCQKVGQEEDLDEEIEPIPDDEIAAEEDPEGDAAAAIVESTHGIAKGQYLYAFHEYPIKQSMTAEEKAYYFGTGSLGGADFVEQDTKGSCRVPGAYLGKFIVIESNPQGLSVAPADKLTDGQRQQIGKQLAWVLYERLPTDSHELFKDVEAAQLPNLLPIQRLAQGGIPIPQASYRAMIDEYARDGKEVTGRVPPFRMNQVVEFIKEYEKQVNLVVEGELPANDKPFNVDGRAQLKSVMQDKPAKFEVGDQASFDGMMANQLIQQGFAKAVGQPTYSRQLRDYQFSLNNFQLQFNDVAVERDLIKGQVADLTSSLKRLQEQIDKHVSELELLRADQKGFQIESTQLDEYRKTLKQRLAILQGEVQTRSFAVNP